MVCEFIDKNHLYYTLEKFLEEVLYLTDTFLRDIYNTINGEIVYYRGCSSNEKGKSKGFWGCGNTCVHNHIFDHILFKLFTLINSTCSTVLASRCYNLRASAQ